MAIKIWLIIISLVAVCVVSLIWTILAHSGLEQASNVVQVVLGTLLVLFSFNLIFKQEKLNATWNGFLRGKVQQLEAVVAREHSLWRREAFAGKIRACRLSICPIHSFLERTSSSAEAPKT
jgi:hypothetical protein